VTDPGSVGQGTPHNNALSQGLCWHYLKMQLQGRRGHEREASTASQSLGGQATDKEEGLC